MKENMSTILTARRNYLKNIIEKMKRRTNGEEINCSIRAISHGKGYQYYKRDANGISYIKAGDIDFVRKRVQLEYDTKVLRTAEQECRKIENLVKVYEGSVVEDIYDMMPAGKRILVKPEVLSDEEYLKQWKDKAYEHLGFRDNAPEYYSAKGERMRSKSEVIIANLLDRLNIDYKYEMPLQLNHIGIVHPDFTILNVKARKEIYWEHLGMLDDQVYRNNAINKIRCYENSGYFMGDKLMITAESSNCPLDINIIEKKIRHILEI